MNDYSEEIWQRYHEQDPKATCRNITFQVTDDCCLKCTYCYQGHKGHAMMTKETAKKIVDLLFKLYDENKEDSPINHHTYGIILDFIGGEPFMNVEVMDYTMEYFLDQCFEKDHIWLTNFRASISTNGILYFQPQVQHFLQKYKNFISMNVTIDGPKKTHDLCRVDAEGHGSFDRAIAAWEHWQTVIGQKAVDTKVTISPENLEEMEDIFDFFLSRGCTAIHANPVFEHKWTIEEAQLYYCILIRLAERLLKTPDAHSSLFNEAHGKPLMSSDTSNWCWGAGTPILTSEGYIPIEKITVGTMVYTHDGTLHSVINTMSHYAENTVNLSISGAYDLICTANHQLYAQPFDYLGFKGVKHWKPYGKYAVNELQPKDLIQLFEVPEGNLSIDKDIAYLVGRYIGDGWDARDHRAHSICCAFEETEELRKYFEKANIKYTINHNKTVNQFDILHTPDTELLHLILQQCGHLATGKHLPPEVWHWDRQSQVALLEGYLAADGNYDEKKDRYKINTVSRQLAEDLLLLLRTIGYTPTCYVYKRAGKSIIQGREVTIHDRYEIYFYNDKEKSKYVKHMNGKLWTSHIQVTPAEPQIVYNITVDENHSYIAAGIVSANCGGVGAMLAFDPQGNAYPCLRYMASSLGTDRAPIIIGNTDGIYNTPEYKAIYDDMQKVTRQSQSTQECLDCPVASGCAWCSAWNYQETGSYNKRSTNICWMHRANALANTYYWNLYYRLHKSEKRMPVYLPRNIATKIINDGEYDQLLQLSI